MRLPIVGLLLGTSMALGAMFVASCVSDEPPANITPTPDSGTTPEGDAGVQVDGGSCNPESQKACGNDCVGKEDPNYGCADGCDPCQERDFVESFKCGGAANRVCQAERCAFGRANCDNNTNNGCETDISIASKCGSCAAGACPGAAPFCVDVDGGPDAGNETVFTCSSNCPTTSPNLCGDAGAQYCTNTTSSTSNCGGCGRICPSYTNGSRTCTNSSCQRSCFTPGSRLVVSGDAGTCVTDQATCLGGGARYSNSVQCCAGPSRVKGECELCTGKGVACSSRSPCCAGLSCRRVGFTTSYTCQVL